jgi:hypothetical protein
MKIIVLFGLICVASANVCTNPESTRDEYIEGLCCSRICNGVCSANSQCVSGDCRDQCCVSDLNDVNCVACNVEGRCASCSDGFSLLNAFHPDAGTFVQEGADILGVVEDGDGKFGHSLAMSSDGKVIAVGAHMNPAHNNDGTRAAGTVRVFELISGAWTQRGGDIDGEDNYDQFGYSIDLSGDGTVLAIGAQLHDVRDESGSVLTLSVGQVRIFDWKGSSWVQRGEAIEGESINDKLGYSVSLSGDGNTVAVGTPNKQDVSPSYKGRLVIFYWNGVSWQQKGTIFEGIGASERVGNSISLSTDGDRIAYTREGSADTVNVFTWVNGAWGNMKTVQLTYLSSVDLSPDGSTIAVSAATARENGVSIGNVKVFQFDASGHLVQVGGDLNDFFSNTGAGSEIGSSVSLSSDGGAVVIGAVAADSSTLTDTGQVVVLDWTGTTWRKRSEFIGTEAGSRIGHGVKISEDGYSVVFSSFEEDQGDGRLGAVRVYEWDSGCGSSSIECCVKNS